jgi:hypothetical protein
VAGTSEYIHDARTSANASVPCRVKILSFRELGRKTQQDDMIAPLTATTMGVSYGGCRARASILTASPSVDGSRSVSWITGASAVDKNSPGLIALWELEMREAVPTGSRSRFGALAN